MIFTPCDEIITVTTKYDPLDGIIHVSRVKDMTLTLDKVSWFYSGYFIDDYKYELVGREAGIEGVFFNHYKRKG